MEQAVRRVIKNLKESGEWSGYEDRLDIFIARNDSSRRAIVLLILRAESPEAILLQLEHKPRGVVVRDEVKRQIMKYFSDSPARYQWPKAFTIEDWLNKDAVVRQWFSHTDPAR